MTYCDDCKWWLLITEIMNVNPKNVKQKCGVHCKNQYVLSLRFLILVPVFAWQITLYVLHDMIISCDILIKYPYRQDDQTHKFGYKHNICNKNWNQKDLWSWKDVRKRHSLRDLTFRLGGELYIQYTKSKVTNIKLRISKRGLCFANVAPLFRDKVKTAKTNVTDSRWGQGQGL